jgi:tRNA(adenine34) deaminase
MTPEDDAHYMRMAIDASFAAVHEGNMPYGAVMVSADGELVHVAKNNQVTSGDCTGHAETVLIREVCAAHGADRLAGATVYASGEPCAMCAGALFWAKVGRVVFGASNATIMRIGGPPALGLNSTAVLASGSHAVKVDGPLLEDEAAAVLRARN